MTLSLLLLPAVGGYWFLTHWNYTRYQAVRESGYRLLFRSAVVGLFLSFLSRIITLPLEGRCTLFSSLWESFLREPFPLEVLFQDPFSVEVLLSLVLAVVLPVFFNAFYDDQKGAERAAKEAGDHIELLIQESIDDQVPVEVTLRNRKIYIGLGLESGIGTNSESDVALIPIYSGYRDEKTLNLNIEIDYLSVIWEFLEYDKRRRSDDDADRWSSEEFRVVIPVTEVVSARLFDEELYDDFAEPEGQTEEDWDEDDWE